jgi:hypothetical protein
VADMRHPKANSDSVPGKCIELVEGHFSGGGEFAGVELPVFGNELFLRPR